MIRDPMLDRTTIDFANCKSVSVSVTPSLGAFLVRLQHQIKLRSSGISNGSF